MTLNGFDSLRPHDHVILLARPVSELIAHARDFKVPSWALVARAVQVLALAIFRWHLCDYILFPDARSFCHNIDGKVSVVDKKIFKNQYPYLIESAIFLRFKSPGYFPRTTELNSDSFKLYHQELTPQSLVDYYRSNEGVEISSKQAGSTINDLLSSKALVILDYYHDYVFDRQLQLANS